MTQKKEMTNEILGEALRQLMAEVQATGNPAQAVLESPDGNVVLFVGLLAPKATSENH